MKKVKEAMKEKGASDEEVKAFEQGASGYAKKIISNFKDYEFLIGESMDPDGMYVALITQTQYPLSSLLTITQGRSPQLPRGRCHPIRYHLEARSHRDEGLDNILRHPSRSASRKLSCI